MHLLTHFTPTLGLLFLLISIFALHLDAAKQSNYLTAYACEGKTLHIRCEQPGTLINLIRANYGRYSISICNEQGNLEWKVDCTSHRSLYVIKNRCDQQSECMLAVNSDQFDDQCPGTYKYLEVHYNCTSDPSTINSSFGNLTEPFVVPDPPSTSLLDFHHTSLSTSLVHNNFEVARPPTLPPVVVPPPIGLDFPKSPFFSSTTHSVASENVRHPVPPPHPSLSTETVSLAPPKIIVPEQAFPAPEDTSVQNGLPPLAGNTKSKQTALVTPSSHVVGFSSATQASSIGTSHRLPSSSLFVKPQSNDASLSNNTHDQLSISRNVSHTHNTVQTTLQVLDTRFMLNLITILLGSTALCASILLFSLVINILYRSNKPGVDRKKLASIQLLIQLSIGFTLVVDHLSQSSDALPAITIGASHLFGSMLIHYLLCVWFQMLLLQTLRTLLRFNHYFVSSKSFNSAHPNSSYQWQILEFCTKPAVAYPVVYLAPLLSIGWLATLRFPAPFYTLHFALSSTFTGNRAPLSIIALSQARSQLLLALIPFYIVLGLTAIVLLLCARLHWQSSARSPLFSCPIGCECGSACKPQIDSICTLPSGHSLQQPMFDNHFNATCNSMFTLSASNRSNVNQMIQSQKLSPSACLKFTLNVACQSSKFLLALFSISSITWALYLAFLYQLLSFNEMSNQAHYCFASIFALFNFFQSLWIARSLLSCRHKVNSVFVPIASSTAGSTGSSAVDSASNQSRYPYLPSFISKWLPNSARSTSSPTPLIPSQIMGTAPNSTSTNATACVQNIHQLQNSNFGGPMQLIVPTAPPQQSVYFYSIDANQLPNVHHSNNSHSVISNQQLQHLQTMHHFHNAQPLVNTNGSLTLAHPSARNSNSIRVSQQTLPPAPQRASYPVPSHLSQVTSSMNGFAPNSHSYSAQHSQLQQEYEDLRSPIDSNPSSSSTFTYSTLPLGASSASTAVHSFKMNAGKSNMAPLPDISLQASTNIKHCLMSLNSPNNDVKSNGYQRDEDMYLYESVDSPQHCFYDTRSPIYYTDGNRQ